jgi:hypothetical protein
MAKQKKAEYPKSLKDLKGYVLVTDDNKAKALVVGRIIYDIDAKTLVCRCAMEVRVRHEKGHWFVTNHQQHGDFDYWVIDREEPVQEYRDYLMSTVGRVKEAGRCYIKISDKIARYERR